MFGPQRDLNHLDYEVIKHRAREERARYLAQLVKVCMSAVGQFVRRQLSVPQLLSKKQQIS